MTDERPECEYEDPETGVPTVTGVAFTRAERALRATKENMEEAATHLWNGRARRTP